MELKRNGVQRESFKSMQPARMTVKSNAFGCWSDSSAVKGA
jgi:hypothetical protein